MKKYTVPFMNLVKSVPPELFPNFISWVDSKLAEFKCDGYIAFDSNEGDIPKFILDQQGNYMKKIFSLFMPEGQESFEDHFKNSSYLKTRNVECQTDALDNLIVEAVTRVEQIIPSDKKSRATSKTAPIDETIPKKTNDAKIQTMKLERVDKSTQFEDSCPNEVKEPVKLVDTYIQSDWNSLEVKSKLEVIDRSTQSDFKDFISFEVEPRVELMDKCTQWVYGDLNSCEVNGYHVDGRYECYTFITDEQIQALLH